MSIKKVAATLKKENNFLITTHMNPEGDALGSELAFLLLLKKIGKRGVIVNEDPFPSELTFLPGKEKVKIFNRNAEKIKFNCFVALDCSDLKRCGRVSSLNKGKAPILNIDHHISNERFGSVDWVNSSASSTSEMIYGLYKEMKVRLDKYSALYLYVGICTDTGYFRYSNTTFYTHAIAADLLKYGINPKYVYDRIYGNIDLDDVKLILRLLPNLKFSANGKIAWFQIKKSFIENRQSSFDLGEHLLSFARSIRGVEVVALFKENLGKNNEIRVNLRSQGKVDVNRIARIFGGGGHKTASGLTVYGTLTAVRKKILSEIRKNLDESPVRI